MPAQKKYYAVTDKSGKLIRQENNHLHPLLVFDTKSGAVAAKWNDGEKVIPITISRETLKD